MKIVDDKGCVVPVNTQGELHIRAYSMMLYYLEDEEKTKEFRDRNGWAHTGYVYGTCSHKISDNLPWNKSIYHCTLPKYQLKTKNFSRK